MQRQNAKLQTLSSVTCLGCGCACDDIVAVVRDERILEARNACPLGRAWFGDGRVPARTRAGARDVSLTEALDAAAQAIVAAARPLVYLAPGLSCETQREAVAIADMLRAALDSVTSATTLDAVLAAQVRGRAAATLGELRNRADVVVCWGVDPSRRYPRFASRYAPEPNGLHVPQGRRSRTVMAVDIGEARGPEDADLRVTIAPDEEVAWLTEARALARGVPLQSSPTEVGIGAPEALLTLLHARYVAIVADAEPEPDRLGRVDPSRAESLIAFAQALNDMTRCALVTLRAGGNVSGADAVVTWQTGYPVAVDFSRGFPMYRPYDGTARERLSRGEVDTLLLLGAPAAIPPDLAPMMAAVPRVLIGPRAGDTDLADGAIVIETAAAGIHEGGTALRMDDVPLPLRAVVNGPVAAVEAVAALRERIGVARGRRAAEGWR